MAPTRSNNDHREVSTVLSDIPVQVHAARLARNLLSFRHETLTSPVEYFQLEPRCSARRDPAEPSAAPAINWRVHVHRIVGTTNFVHRYARSGIHLCHHVHRR